MSKYQDMSEIKNDAEFQEFVKLELNRDIDSIRDYELTAMFYKAYRRYWQTRPRVFRQYSQNRNFWGTG